MKKEQKSTSGKNNATKNLNPKGKPSKGADYVATRHEQFKGGHNHAL